MRWFGSALLLLLLAGCGHTPVTRTIVETFSKGVGVDAINLNPALSYLRVSSDGREALLVLGYSDPHPLGDIDTWYSASGEVFKFQNGRLLSTTGLKLDWREIRYASLPSWTALFKNPSARFERERDEMPGHRFGIRETVEISAVSPPRNANLMGLSPLSLRWFEERVVASPRPLSSARYGVALQDDGKPPLVVYGEQCLRPDFCISWQTWPAGPSRAASAP